jgi:hypothetical protein
MARVTTDENWFASVGFDVSYEEADGWTWAALHRHGNPKSVVPKYGRGTSKQEAVASARRRYEVEQIGNDNERKPGDQLP